MNDAHAAAAAADADDNNDDDADDDDDNNNDDVDVDVSVDVDVYIYTYSYMHLHTYKLVHTRKIYLLIVLNVLSLSTRTCVVQKWSLNDAIKESSLLTQCLCKSFQRVFRVRMVLHPGQL